MNENINEWKSLPLKVFKRNTRILWGWSIASLLALLLVLVQFIRGEANLGDDALMLIVPALASLVLVSKALNPKVRLSIHSEGIWGDELGSFSWDEIKDIYLGQRAGYKGIKVSCLWITLLAGDQRYIDVDLIIFNFDDLDQAIKKTSFKGDLGIEEELMAELE